MEHNQSDKWSNAAEGLPGQTLRPMLLNRFNANTKQREC